MEQTQHPQRGDQDLGSRPPPGAEAIREQLQKILSSRTFRSAAHERSFLRYAVEQAIEGHSDRIKEYSVGVEVFGRGESFDPRQDSIVRTEARNLRSRLTKYYEREGAQDPLRIEVPKGRYAPIFVDTPSSNQAPAGIPIEVGAPSPTGFPFRWKAAGVLLLGALIVAGSVGYRLRFGGNESGPSPDAASIAVLPFLNLSGDKDQDFFSDGLTEELIESLARVRGLHVVARTSVFQFRGKSLDIREIGQRLKVRTVLEGSVRKSGSRLRITAQLNDASNGYHLWAQSYDRELKDALAIQREISLAITDALGVKLAGIGSTKPLTSLGDAPSHSPEAHEDYLKGRYVWNKLTGESLKTAIAYFERAIAKDPGYAPAYAALARTYAGIPVFTATPAREIVPKVRAAAFKALELDDSLGEAHLSLAFAYLDESDWKGAEREFRKGLELSPGDAFAHHSYHVYLEQTGQLEPALAESKVALDLDPVSLFMMYHVAKGLYLLHRYDEAIEQYRTALALEPNFGLTHQGLGIVYLKKGMYAQGIAETELASRLMGGDPFITGQLGYAYAVSGDTARARQVLSDVLDRYSRGVFPALAVAKVYIGIGDRDRAFEWLRKAIDQRNANVALKVDPCFDSLRSDPRFAVLLRRMKLA